MASTVKLRVTRAMMLHGARVPADTLIEVAANVAADLLDSRRVELVDPRDAPAVAAARREEVRALLARAEVANATLSGWVQGRKR